MTLEQIQMAGPTIKRALMDATTEADIRRHQIEDGEDPDAEPPHFRAPPSVRDIRARLGMTQQAFANAIGVPVATVRNWDQNRTALDPAVQTLPRGVDREPQAVFQALAG